MPNSTTSFGEDGRPVLTSDPDWDAIAMREENLANESVLTHLKTERRQIRRDCRNGSLTDEDFDRALELCGTLFRWVWQSGKRDSRGLTLRAIIVCWVFLPEIQHHPMTRIAMRFGKFKQSLGRWVEHKENGFNATFPRWRIPSGLNSKMLRGEVDRREAERMLEHHARAAMRLAALLGRDDEDFKQFSSRE